jgi:hypothetical protein
VNLVVVCALKGWNFEAGGAGDQQKGSRSTKGDPFDFSLAPARRALSYVEYTISHITMATGHEGCAFVFQCHRGGREARASLWLLRTSEPGE